MAQGRPLEVHSVGGGLEGGNAGLARGVERVGAGEVFRGVGDAFAVGVWKLGLWRHDYVLSHESKDRNGSKHMPVMRINLGESLFLRASQMKGIGCPQENGVGC